jgi:glycosyltransferase involved in cell wall biosynthesis
MHDTPESVDTRPAIMTAASRFTPSLPSGASLPAPCSLDPGDVSLVVPVWNDQRGIARLVEAFARLEPSARPQEIIVVDDGSTPAIVVADEAAAVARAKVVRAHHRGPAAARNLGWRAARSSWILFTDADCVPSPSLLLGYGDAMNGAVAYAGAVEPLGNDFLSRYYATQKILVPPPTNHSEPGYLVTANALVWRPALERVGGFDERFRFAGGEDIDLALRLAEIGRSSYAPAAVVHHDFSDGVAGFFRRFVRYGRGNRLLAEVHRLDMTPKPFRPAHGSLVNYACAGAQYLAMLIGYALP